MRLRDHTRQRHLHGLVPDIPPRLRNGGQFIVADAEHDVAMRGGCEVRDQDLGARAAGKCHGDVGVVRAAEAVADEVEAGGEDEGGAGSKPAVVGVGVGGEGEVG